MMKVHLIVIDPQVDFCTPTGALWVPGADKDMVRLAAMINRLGNKITQIHVTLDQHHFLSIFHPIYWLSKKGEHPPIFTKITSADIEDKVWRPWNPVLNEWSLNYVRTLEAGGRYPLVIWPYHCLIGSPGAAIVPDLFVSFMGWQHSYKQVEFISKGSNYRTEHYSAVKAEVADPQDPKTNIDTKFMKLLESVDIIALAGEARSHCLANTVNDIAGQFNASNISKFVLLTDASSDVTDCKDLGDTFVSNMVARGMRVSTTTEFLS